MVLPDFPPILVAVVSGTLGLVLLLLLLRIVAMAHEARRGEPRDPMPSSDREERRGHSEAMPVAEVPGRPSSPSPRAPVSRQEPLVAEEVVPALPEVHLRGVSPAVTGASSSSIRFISREACVGF